MTNLTDPGANGQYDNLVEVPDEGEEVTAVAGGVGKGPVRPGFQGHFNNACVLHEALLQESLVSRASLRSDGDTNFTVSCPGRVALKAASAARYSSGGLWAQTFGPAVLRPAAANWPASSWLYVYANSTDPPDETLLDVTVWATPPDSGLLNKSDGTRYRYLGCFRTGAGGAPTIVPFWSERGLYTYESFETGDRVLVDGSSVAFADVSLASRVPPHVMSAEVYAVLTCTIPDGAAAGPANVALRRKGYGGNGARIYATGINAMATAQVSAGVRRVRTDATRVIQYSLNNANNRVDLYVYGFQE